MKRPATCTFCGGELEGSVCPRCRYDFTNPVEVPGQPACQEFNIRHDAPLAGWWTRWIGYAIIDQIVVSAIAFAAGFLISVAVYSGAEHWTEEDRANLTNDLTLLALSISFLYFWMANSLGRSIGKLVLGLRVVTTEDATAPGLGRGLIRTIGYYVSGLFLGLGFLWAAWDKDKQGWHDKMAGTIVIKSRGRQVAPASRPGSAPAQSSGRRSATGRRLLARPLLVLWVVCLLVAVAAFTVAGWAYFGTLPWERGQTGGPTASRYTPEEAVGFVRAALQREWTCSTSISPAKRCAAVFDANEHAWEVACGCFATTGPPLAVIPDKWTNYRWRFFEEGDRVIPLADDAANAMHPSP